VSPEEIRLAEKSSVLSYVDNTDGFLRGYRDYFLNNDKQIKVFS